MSYKIEKNVPMPLVRGKVSRFPFEKLTVGESFFVPQSEADDSNVRGSASNFCKKAPAFMFTIAKVTEDGIKGVRVWRVEKKEDKK